MTSACVIDAILTLWLIFVMIRMSDAGLKFLARIFVNRTTTCDGLPTADDLDYYAEEERIRLATSGKDADCL